MKYLISGVIAAALVLVVSVSVFACAPKIEPTCEELQNCEVIPTPTEEPTPPSPFNDGGASDSNATKAPAPKVCTGILPDQPVGRPELYKKTSSTSAHFGYFGGNADHYEVEYKYSNNGFVYGIPGGLPGTSTEFDLNDLEPGFNTLLARVHAFRGGCELFSEWFN